MVCAFSHSRIRVPRILSRKKVSVIVEQKQRKKLQSIKSREIILLFDSHPKKHFPVTCIEVTIA